jgi:hypothetical protein
VERVRGGQVYVVVDRRGAGAEAIPYDPIRVSVAPPPDTFDYTFYKTLKPGHAVSVATPAGWVAGTVVTVEEGRALIRIVRDGRMVKDWMSPKTLRAPGDPTTRPATKAATKSAGR